MGLVFCKWKKLEQYYWYSIWKSSCGERYEINGDFLPSKVGFNYCPNCGKKIKE